MYRTGLNKTLVYVFFFFFKKRKERNVNFVNVAI